MLALLASAKKLSGAQLLTEFQNQLEFAEDIAIDIPNIATYLAQLVRRRTLHWLTGWPAVRLA